MTDPMRSHPGISLDLTVSFSPTRHGYAASTTLYPVTGFGTTPDEALYDLREAVYAYSERNGAPWTRTFIPVPFAKGSPLWDPRTK